MVQGLADTFIILGMAFDSPEAKQLNKDIFECIYYHALVTSTALAKVEGEKQSCLLQMLLLTAWQCTFLPSLLLQILGLSQAGCIGMSAFRCRQSCFRFIVMQHQPRSLLPAYLFVLG